MRHAKDFLTDLNGIIFCLRLSHRKFIRHDLGPSKILCKFWVKVQIYYSDNGVSKSFSLTMLIFLAPDIFKGHSELQYACLAAMLSSLSAYLATVS